MPMCAMCALAWDYVAALAYFNKSRALMILFSKIICVIDAIRAYKTYVGKGKNWYSKITFLQRSIGSHFHVINFT